MAAEEALAPFFRAYACLRPPLKEGEPAGLGAAELQRTQEMLSVRDRVVATHNKKTYPGEVSNIAQDGKIVVVVDEDRHSYPMEPSDVVPEGFKGTPLLRLQSKQRVVGSRSRTTRNVKGGRW